MKEQRYIDFTLPEFAFIDANAHEGNLLEDRTVIQHIRSYTIVEVVLLDEFKSYDFSNSKTHEFKFVNFAGVIENHLVVLHFSLAEENDLSEIFTKIADWYWDYLTWEDKNILENE